MKNVFLILLMINSLAMAQELTTVKINELATSAINSSDYFVKADANGIAYKNTLAGLAGFIGSVGVSGYKGALAIAETPTEDGFYFASESGTYTNAGGLVVDLNAGINIISVEDGQTVFELVVIPVDLSGQLVQEVAEGDTTHAPSADAVYKFVPDMYIGKNEGDSAKFWLDKAKGVNFSTNQENIIGAIKNVFVLRSEVGVTYGLTLLAKNDTTYGNRIGVTDSNGILYFTDNAKQRDGSEIDLNGWNQLKLINDQGVEFYIDIDYSALPEGLLLNGGGIWFNPVNYLDYKYFIDQNLSSDFSDKIKVDTLATHADLMNIEEYVSLNIRYSKISEMGFRGDVLKLVSYSAGNYFRLYDNLTPHFDSNRLDINKKVYIEFDYKVISGLWRFSFWATGNVISELTPLPNDSPNEIKSIRLELDAPGAALSGQRLLNYFSANSTGEILISNVRMFQTDFLTQKPKLGDEVTKDNAIAINTTNLNKQIIDSTVAKNRPAFSKKNIVFAGSSITWDQGDLNGGFVGYVDRELFKKEWANTLLSTELNYSVPSTDFENPKLFSEKAKQITGVGSKVSFDMYGDELAICQVKRRTTDYATFTVKADGVLLGTFDNKNHTLGSDSENFIGDGSKVKFMLAHPYTYNHAITVNGVTQTVQINTGGYGSPFPPGIDVFIIRNLNSDGEVKHVAWFANPPANGDSIAVNYDYGKVVMYEGSTVGQTINDETNESNYGDGNTSFDPANPANLSSGLEFRYADPKSYIRHHFDDIKKRHIEIEITGGTNPYFAVDFVSNRFINFMNAGIGGWTLSQLLNNDKRNDWSGFFERFAPDLIVNESATNDDWSFGSRRISRILNGVSESDLKNMWTLELGDITFNPGTSDYTVVSNTGIIDSITRFSLISPQVVGSDVQVGDIIRIGNYYGDNNQVAVREVNAVDTVTGEIEWLIPISADEILNIDKLGDLVGAEIAIRDLSGYSDLYQQLLDLIQDVSPDTEILLTNPGLSNYFSRQLWGYNIVHSKLAKVNNNVHVIDVTEWIDDVQSNIISGALSSDITATGASEYTLPFTGHRQGYKVLVNGLDVYGKDCYIVTGQGYTVDQNGSGADLGQTGNYNRAHHTTKNAKLVFFANAPASGTITIQRADKTWSNDYTHPNSFGSIVYGKKYIEVIKRFL